MLARKQRYERVIASRMELAIGAKDMQALMRERTIATREQMHTSQFFSGAALHAPLDEFGAICQDTRFQLPSTFATQSICTISYFAGADQDCTDELRGVTLQHHFCTATQGKCHIVSSGVL